MSNRYRSILSLGSSTPPFSNVNSFSFDGIDDYFMLPSAITLPTDFSVSMWVKATTGGSVRDQVFGGASGFFLFGTVVLSGGLLSNKMCYYNGSSYVALTPAIRDGNWHNIVITYNSSATNLIAYTDGVETYNATYNAGTNNVIDRISEDTYTNYWKGNLDELAVWTSELTSSDVTSIYNSGVPNDISSLSPFVWFRMGDNATWNGATWTMTSVGTDTRIARSINMVEANRSTDVPTASSFTNTKSILLDGVDDYVDCGNDASLQITNTLSISAWVKTTDTNYIGIYGKGNSVAQADTYFRMQNTGVIRTFLNNNTINVTGTTAINDGNWHHVMFVYVPSTSMTIYVDGSQDAQNTTSIPSAINNNYSNVYIGQFQKWLGNIDEVAVWNSDQSANVSTIYNGGVPNDISSLSPLSWWRMGDGDTAPTLTDNGSGGNNGTMTNFTTFSTDVPT